MGFEWESSNLDISFSKKVQIDGGFIQLMDEIKTADIKLPAKPVIISGMDDAGLSTFGTISLIEDDVNVSKKLNAKDGCKIAQDDNALICAYDESIAYYASLEGKVAYVSHSLVTMHKGQYYPLNHLNLLFCTKSSAVCNRIPGAELADKWDIDTTISVHIAQQKGTFLEQNVYSKSILLVDGPYLAGDGSFYFDEPVKRMIKKGIFPVFIVKNSYSSILIDNVPELKGKYNSDLHYANEVLNEGSRTSFFQYKDSKSGKKSKVFCYLKHKDHYSPIRIEIPAVAFDNNREVAEASMDLIYYLILVQGSTINPQVRPIAIAEMYARETLNLINISKDVIEMKLTATMNEQRGME